MGSSDYTFGDKDFHVSSEDEMLAIEDDAVVNLSKFATDAEDFNFLTSLLGLEEAVCRLSQSRTPKTA